MPRINVLESTVYNRISAGEVVERPSSVVKELVENSLDAGASSITIRIVDGGIKLISIVDNGCGIVYDDLKKAFLPHSTSKISSADDLDTISTLGFRGEALASIGAVSQTEIISKTADSDFGGRIEDNGGVISESSIVGVNNGTTINVKNLFFNTPARLKFLKTPKQEESLVTNIVNRLMFANPHISFKYIVNDKIVYNSQNKELKDKIFEVYGKEISNNLICFDKRDKKYSLSGYISYPTSCKANRTYQTLIVNGRYVTNTLVSTAISNAYSNFLMKGKFPLYVLYISLPFDDLDVNVHPSKMEVRFKDSRDIYNFVYYAVLETLQENNYPIDYTVDNNISSPFEKEEEKSDKVETKKIQGGFSFGSFEKLKEDMGNITVKAPTYIQEDENMKLSSNNNSEYMDYHSESNFIEKDLNKILESKGSVFDRQNGEHLDDFKENPDKKLLREDKIDIVQEKLNNFEVDFRVLGTIFNTYILIESGDNFLLLDQHAGHERVLFDKFMAMYENKKIISQPMLLPYAFTVNEIEQNLLLDNLSILSEMGFEIEDFGHNTYRIYSVPSILSDIDLEQFVMESLSDINVISKNNEQIRQHFATCACKSAVKGGQALNNDEINILLKQIFENDTRLQCPHGRPICVKFTKYEVEKMFKRIVN